MAVLAEPHWVLTRAEGSAPAAGLRSDTQEKYGTSRKKAYLHSGPERRLLIGSRMGNLCARFDGPCRRAARWVPRRSVPACGNRPRAKCHPAVPCEPFAKEFEPPWPIILQNRQYRTYNGVSVHEDERVHARRGPRPSSPSGGARMCVLSRPLARSRGP